MEDDIEMEMELAEEFAPAGVDETMKDDEELELSQSAASLPTTGQ